MNKAGIIFILVIVAVMIILVALKLGNNKNNSSQSNLAQSDGVKGENMDQDQAQNSSAKDSVLSFQGKLPDNQIENKKAVIKTDKGVIEIALWANKAPLTVSNFVYLVNKGFYNGLTFHRVEAGFVVQGGDPNSNGTGGPDYQFQDEPVQGEYTEGTIAMANSGKDTNGSQFFINLVDNSKNLTKSYNLFGEVISGMDVVKKIVVGGKMNSVKIVDNN